MPGYPSNGIGTHYGDTSIVTDVTDLIFQITPEDTPVTNIVGRTSAQAVTHEWQQRDISTRQANAQPEGFTYNFTGAMQLPTRVTNVSQIMNKEVRVSDTERAVSHYAIDDLAADQMETAMVGIKTDMEHTIIQGTLASGNATDAARSMSGLIQVISTYVTSYKDAAAVSLSEAMLNDYLEICWDLGGSPKDWFMKGALKRRISGFTASSTKFIESDQRRLVNTVSVYESDFFVVNMHLCRDIPATTTDTVTYNALMGLDRTMIKWAQLRPFVAKRTAAIADSYDGVIVGEGTIEWGNALAHYYADYLL